MGALRFNIHQQVSTEDVSVLARIAAEVAHSNFRSTFETEVRWGIPSASEADEPKLALTHLTPSQKLDLEGAVTCFFNKQFADAKERLEPFVSVGHEEASKLYVKVLRQLRSPDWKKVAELVNRISKDTLYVPAGSTEYRDGKQVILIHQGLCKSIGHDAPKCVIKYVVHHEYLHINLGTDPSDPHPALFRRLDASFPERSRSIRWLQKNHFSTIEDHAK